LDLARTPLFAGGALREFSWMLRRYDSQLGDTECHWEMLNYAVVFLVIALIAALLGFTGIAAGAVEIAKILFFVFLLLFLISLVFGPKGRK